MPQPIERHKTFTFGLISLGSNVSTQGYKPLDRLKSALSDLQDSGFTIRATSKYYHAPFFPPNQGADFVNAVAEVAADIPAEEAMRRFHEVENNHNRERPYRWSDRTLDIDLLTWTHEGEDLVRPDPQIQAEWRNLPLEEQKKRAPKELILPHPRLQDRAFVLIPLSDIAPEFRHPVTGETLRQMLDVLPESDKSAIFPLKT